MSKSKQEAPKDHSQNAGGDEAFISFAFVIVTVLMLMMYSSTAIRVCKAFGMAVINMTPWGNKGEKKRYRPEEEEDSVGKVLLDAKNYFLYVPNIILTFMANPLLATTGLRMLLANKPIFYSIALPKFFRSVLRVRLIIVILWVVLFSMALYTNLSFDAYKVLDLTPDASDKDVKKRYRQLTKLHHPDHNRDNATALAIYTQVRKAYKALIKKEEFEEDAQKEDLSIGVALPSWVTNRENDFLIKIIVLASLIGFPYWLFKKFSGNDGDKITVLCKRIVKAEMDMVPLYKNFGIPMEKKLFQQENGVELYTMAWNANGIPIPDSLNMYYLPALDTFMKLASDVPKNQQFFNQVGLNNQQLVEAVVKCLNEGLAIQKEAEDKMTFSTTVTPIGDTEFQAAFYVFQLAVDDCEEAIDQLNVIVNNSIKQLYVLRNFHKKISEVLVWAQEKKLAARDTDTLLEAARTGKTEALGILPAINQTMQKFQKQQQQEYKRQMGM